MTDGALSSVQITRLKKARRPYNHTSYNKKPVAVVMWSPEKPNTFWAQDYANVPMSIKHDLARKDFTGSPFPFLGSRQDLEAWTNDRLDAHEVPPQFLGAHGVPGIPYPPTDYYDGMHEWDVDSDRGKRVIENWRTELVDEHILNGEDDDEDDDDEEEEDEDFGEPRDEHAEGLVARDGHDDEDDEDDEDDDDDDGEGDEPLAGEDGEAAAAAADAEHGRCRV